MPRILQNHYVLAVHDLKRSAGFFVDALDFKVAADRYFDELKAKGVEVSSPISDKPWGMREFGLTNPEGHRLMIGQWIGGDPL
jgi:uncharacterized glyoxalase superfamily protein PhnB